ncbi:MAG: N-alpha-acetyltransferase mak3 [Geoglossum simile]|nr:MAG: N-alpha-acetyltransferase mak3 [Geoglossum simile]
MSGHDCQDLRYIQYDSCKGEVYLEAIRQIISKDLSEPYSIYVYRYFLYQWGHLCFMALDKDDSLVGVVVNKLERHRGGPMRGYIAMLAVKQECRGKGIGQLEIAPSQLPANNSLATRLVRMAIDAMIERDADEVALETEITNTAAMKLYERLGFLRSKRLHRYYLNGNTAFRLVLYLKEGTGFATCAHDIHDNEQAEPLPSCGEPGT